MRNAKKEAGVAAIEMALLLPLLILLLFGVTEFGRATYQYNALAKSVRDSARYLSQFAPGDGVRSLEARSMVLCGAVDCSNRTPLVPGMTLSYVRVRDRISDPGAYNLQSTGRGTVNLVRVEVSGFTFRSLATGYVPNMTFAPISATMEQVP
jgi:hypothetical protein